MRDKLWDVHQLPSQAGKTIIVTGATSGIGYEAALALAKADASALCRFAVETALQSYDCL